MCIVSAFQHIGGIADLPFSGEKYQHIAGSIEFRKVFCGACNGFGEFLLLFHFLINVFNGKEFSFHFDHRCAVKKFSDPAGFQCGGGNDDPQIPPFGKEQFQITQKKIDIQTAFVDFVKDDAVVLKKHGIGFCFCQQDTVRHKFDHGAICGFIIEPDFVAHFVACIDAGLCGEPGSQCSRSQPSWLGTADPAGSSESFCEGGFRQLCGLSGSGGTANDDHLIFLQCGADLRDLFRDGQIGRKIASQFFCMICQRAFCGGGKFFQQSIFFCFIRVRKKRAVFAGQPTAFCKAYFPPKSGKLPPDLILFILFHNADNIHHY